MGADDLRWDLLVSKCVCECVCTHLTGFYHVKSYPTKGVTFSHQDSRGQFSGFWGIVERKKLAISVRAQLLTTLPNLVQKGLCFHQLRFLEIEFCWGFFFLQTMVVYCLVLSFFS